MDFLPRPPRRFCVCSMAESIRVSRTKSTAENQNPQNESRRRTPDLSALTRSVSPARRGRGLRLKVCPCVLPDVEGVFVVSNHGPCGHGQPWPSQRD